VASSATVLTAIERIEALYRVEGARMWRALVAFAGDREVANDAVAEASPRRSAGERSCTIRLRGYGSRRF
jgi:hypothetical protein